MPDSQQQEQETSNENQNEDKSIKIGLLDSIRDLIKSVDGYHRGAIVSFAITAVIITFWGGFIEDIVIACLFVVFFSIYTYGHQRSRQRQNVRRHQEHSIDLQRMQTPDSASEPSDEHAAEDELPTSE